MTNYMRLLLAFRLLVGILLAAAILGAAGYAAYYLITNKPKPNRRPPEERAPLVVVEEVLPGAEQVVVTTRGNVEPVVEVALQSRVPGEVIRKHPDLVEGGLLRKGDVLVEIDPRDYELALVTRQSQLSQAEADYAMEQGQQDVAVREWEMLGMEGQATEGDRHLALRMPYLKKMEANLDSAKAQLERAKLDLERTRIEAPFNAIVRDAPVDVGDQASTQTVLATLVGTDVYWVRVTIPVDELEWVVVPRGEEEGSPARIIDGAGHTHDGRVLKLLSDLVPDGRMAQLLIEVRDPLDSETGKRAYPLLLGQYVQADIQGRSVDNVFRVPRAALRDGGALWLAGPGGKLKIVRPDIVWSDAEWALLRGIDAPARVILSDLATPVDGMAIQVDGDAPLPGGDAPEAAPAGKEQS